jgi:type II restriction enzyme
MSGTSVKVRSKDVVGRVLEDWLGQWMTDNDIIYSERDNSQLPPDYYLSKTPDDSEMLEIKAFDKERSAAFDIADFKSFAGDILETPERLDAHYLIFEYKAEDGKVSITNTWLKRVWELAGHAGKYPLRLQVKRGEIHKIRPVTWYSDRRTYDPFASREEFLRAINETLLTHDSLDADAYEAWLDTFAQRYTDATGRSLQL